MSIKKVLYIKLDHDVKTRIKKGREYEFLTNRRFILNEHISIKLIRGEYDNIKKELLDYNISQKYLSYLLNLDKQNFTNLENFEEIEIKQNESNKDKIKLIEDLKKNSISNSNINDIDKKDNISMISENKSSNSIVIKKKGMTKSIENSFNESLSIDPILDAEETILTRSKRNRDDNTILKKKKKFKIGLADFDINPDIEEDIKRLDCEVIDDNDLIFDILLCDKLSLNVRVLLALNKVKIY